MTPSSASLTYDEYGSGPVVVLIHGSPGSSKSWLRVGERLATNFRIIAPNLPGYGGSDPRPSDVVSDTAWVARQIESLLETIGEPVVLAGHSYGGNVALTVAMHDALEHRHRANARGNLAVKGLALFEPVALSVLRLAGNDAAYATARAAIDDYVTSQEAGDRRAVRKMFDLWFGAGAFDAMPERAQEHLTNEAARNVLDVKATRLEQYSATDLQRLTVPTLLVYGSKSPKLTFQIVDAMATLVSSSSIVELEGATHAMTATHDGAIAELIADVAMRAGSSP